MVEYPCLHGLHNGHGPAVIPVIPHTDATHRHEMIQGYAGMARNGLGSQETAVFLMAACFQKQVGGESHVFEDS